MDLVVWGHEHECLINPRFNPEMSFHVMQPGSSVATSLVPGEAVAKHVAILSITGHDFKVDTHRLKSVRPFAMKEIVLSEERGVTALAKKDNNRTEITRYLEGIVESLIKKAKADWLQVQGDQYDHEEQEVPLPLIRLRVEFSAPDGGRFEVENPQRFSNRFVGKVANLNDVVSFYRKKSVKASQFVVQDVVAYADPCRTTNQSRRSTRSRGPCSARARQYSSREASAGVLKRSVSDNIATELLW